MGIEVRHHPIRERYEIAVDGELAGITEYTVVDDGVLDFNRTVVRQEFEGRGLASRLVSEALQDVRAQGLTFRPTCSFVRFWLQSHHEVDDALAPGPVQHTVLITGTFRVPPDRLEAAADVMAEMIAASRAEPGCIEYSYGVDLLDPGLIRVHERWRDQEAFEKHLASTHLAAWRAAWPDLGIGHRRLERYDVGEPGTA